MLVAAKLQLLTSMKKPQILNSEICVLKASVKNPQSKKYLHLNYLPTALSFLFSTINLHYANYMTVSSYVKCIWIFVVILHVKQLKNFNLCQFVFASL